LSTPDKVVVTCALTGVLTDPAKFNVPVTPEDMADATAQAYNAGASIVHCHFRDQGDGMGAFPTWDIKSVGDILAAIKERVPDILICMSTGVFGDDLSGPLGCIEAFKPELAACNAGSLNYLKIRKDGQWAWPPMLFDNPVEKVEKFLAQCQPIQSKRDVCGRSASVFRNGGRKRDAGQSGLDPNPQR
jgi:uncharacterized protein (DUF849 family)